jgi:lipopolysaccharide transport system permease protein
MPNRAATRDTPHLVIEAGRVNSRYWRDIWEYRELFAFLAWRDVLVRYKQTVIGILWAVLRPFLTMVVFVVVFHNLGKFPSEGIPYPILVYAAMLPWQFFSTALSESSNSLIGNANLISKVYFPRLIIPASSVVTSLVDLLVAFLVLGLLMAWYDFWPDWRLVTLPLFILLAFAAAMGSGLLLTALNAQYRDFRYVVPFIVQMGLYISPVGFTSAIIPDQWRLVYSINPMVGVIDGFRWALLRGTTSIYLPGLALSVVLTLLLLVIGIVYFRRTEKIFADVI